MGQRFARFFAFRVGLPLGLSFGAGLPFLTGFRLTGGLRLRAGLGRAAGFGASGAGHDTATLALIDAPLTAIAVSDTQVSRPL
jgi:hypothetical protein